MYNYMYKMQYIYIHTMGMYVQYYFHVRVFVQRVFVVVGGDGGEDGDSYSDGDNNNNNNNDYSCYSTCLRVQSMFVFLTFIEFDSIHNTIYRRVLGRILHAI